MSIASNLSLLENSAGQVSITNNTISASTNTGALTVAGGVGIAGGAYVGGTVTATNFILNGYQVSTGTVLPVQYIGNAIGAGTANTLNFGTGTTVSLSNGILTLQVPASVASATGSTATFNWTIDGGGLVPAIGDKAVMLVPFNCYVTQATVVGNAAGSALIYVSTGTVAGWPTRTLISSSTINLSSVQTLQVNTASWTNTVLSSGQLIVANLQSVSGFTFLTVSLTVVKL
jgi:hypothetical protein